MKTLLLASICAASLFAATGANATVTLSGSQFSGLTYEANEAGSTSADVAGIITLTNPDPNNTFDDTALVLVPNGYDGVSLGTLDSLLSQGAAGNVTFNLLTGTDPGNNLAYWDVLLQNPGNPAQTIDVNAFGDNQLNSNPFNLAGQQSVNASCDGNATGGVSTGCFFTTWSPSVTNFFGTWNVLDVSIGIGGQGDGAQTATINSITLPGTPSSVPEPVTISLFGAGLVGAVVMRRRKTSKAALV